jgi:hypothetical protein
MVSLPKKKKKKKKKNRGLQVDTTPEGISHEQ